MEPNAFADPKLYIFGEGSNRYIGENGLTLDEIEQRMEEHKPVTFFKVRQVMSINIPLGPMNIQRRTLFAAVDMAVGPLPSMVVHPSSVYPLEGKGQEFELLMHNVKAELRDAEQRETEARARGAGLTTARG